MLRLGVGMAMVAVLLAGCGDDDRPSAPSNPNRMAVNDGDQTRPAYLPAETFLMGQCTFYLHDAGLQGGLTGGELVGVLVAHGGTKVKKVTAERLKQYLEGADTEKLPTECH